MATIFYDGFDYYAVTDIAKVWTSQTGGACALGPAFARNPSGQGCQLSGTANLIRSFAANYTQGVIGFAFLMVSGSTVSRTIMMVLDGSTEQISVRTDASSRLLVTRQGTQVGTGTSSALTTGVWYYVELKFVIAPTTGGSVDLHLNGSSVSSGTGLNTRSTSVTQWNGVQLQAASGWTANFDDVYVLDTSAGTNTDYLGQVRVVALYPAAAGNSSSWTANGGSNYGCVSEAYEDGDGSFVQSATANQVDTYAMQDLPASSGSVFATQVVTVARQDSGTSRTIAPVVRISGTDYVGTTVSLSTSYQFLKQIYDTQPVGGSPAWDVSTVNGMEIGMKLIS